MKRRQNMEGLVRFFDGKHIEEYLEMKFPK